MALRRPRVRVPLGPQSRKIPFILRGFFCLNFHTRTPPAGKCRSSVSTDCAIDHQKSDNSANQIVEKLSFLFYS